MNLNEISENPVPQVTEKLLYSWIFVGHGIQSGLRALPVTRRALSRKSILPAHHPCSSRREALDNQFLNAFRFAAFYLLMYFYFLEPFERTHEQLGELQLGLTLLIVLLLDGNTLFAAESLRFFVDS